MQHLQFYIQYEVEILKNGLKTSEGLEIHILNALTVGFKHMHTADISFEAMHDNFCYFLQASNRQEFKFGQYISIATLFKALCEGLNNIQIVY